MKLKFLFFSFLLCNTIKSYSQDSAYLNYFLQNCSLYLEAYSVDTTQKGVHHGTGFIIKKHNNLYVLTNQHVIKDTDYYSKKPNNIKGPYSKLRIIGFSKQNGRQTDQYIPLLNGEGAPLYIQGYYNGVISDVVAVPIADTSKLIFEPLEIDTSISLNINDKLIIVGFPSSATNAYNFQVLSASILSDPSKNAIFTSYGIVPVLRIESLNLPGASGSPVFKLSSFTSKPILVGMFGATGNDYSIVWKLKSIISIMNSIP